MFTFHIADYIVGAIVLLVPVLIGAFFAVRDVDKATREEYLMGGRQMSMLPVAMSIFITFQSAISQIGVPSEVYSYGSNYIPFSIGLSLSYIVGIFTFVPLMYPLRLTSIYEYLHLRFRSNTVRLVSTSIGMLTTICYMAVALLSPSLALQAVASLPLWMSILVVGGIGTIYTAVGGIKSVIWTDAFQTVIVFVGISAIIFKGIVEVGSVDQIWHEAHTGRRTFPGSLDPDPRTRHTLWGSVLGGLILWLVNGFNQSTIQRVCAMKSLKAANVSFLLNIPMVIGYNTLLVVVGNIVYAYIAYTKCDPYKAGIISNTNQIAPYFVLDTMDDLPGMVGLYISTLCCGSLSTLSSGINALAANTVEDILRTPLKNVKEGTVTFITKIVVVVYGLTIIGIAWGAKSLKGPVTQMATSVFGACGSPILGIFIIGSCVPWANKYGAVVGAVASLAFNLWVSIGSRMYGSLTPAFEPVTTEMCFPNATFTTAEMFNSSSTITTTATSGGNNYRQYSFFLYDVSYEWYSTMGAFVSVSVGLLVSWITRSKTMGTTDPNLIFPFLRKLYKLEEQPLYHPQAKTILLNVNTYVPENETKTASYDDTL